MSSTTIKRGGRDVTLTKSDRLIGIRPQPGVTVQKLAEITPALRPQPQAIAELGGFQVVAVDSLAGPAPGAPMEAALDKLRSSPLVAAGTHVFHTSDDQVPFVPTGELYVECKAERLQECQQLLEREGLQLVEARGPREFIVRVTPASENPIKVAARLQASDAIETAEPDLATPGQILAFKWPSDTLLLEQWHLRNTGEHRGTTLGFVKGADSRVVEAWEATESLGSPQVVVAVIDDGFDLSHPDLTGTWKIVAPKDFTRNTLSPLPDPMLQDWHGTACAGVAVGNADGEGILGAAPRSRLMPIRWGRDLSDREIENWFDYAREQGAWVVSCSWGAVARYFPLSHRAAKAIHRCAAEGRDELGTVICFAAGNENRDVNDDSTGSVNGFATHPDVIAVGASNSRDQRSSYSNFGREIWVCAPSSGAGGWGVTTSDVMGQYTRGSQTFEAGYSPGGYTHEFGGTSSACPLVAGICALILAINPALKASQVKDILRATARRLGQDGDYADGHSVHFGYGCVDAQAAVRKAMEKKPAALEPVGA